MKIKGFTLVELLAVLVVLALISMIAIPVVNDIVDTSEEKALEQQDKVILDAVKQWTVNNNKSLVYIDENDEMHNISCYLTISRLKDEGYLEEKEYINPTDDTSMDSYVVSLEYDYISKQYNNNIFFNEEEVQDILYTDYNGDEHYIMECP